MENSNRCTKCNGKNTSAQILHSQIPPQQQMLWRDMRGRTMRKTSNESPRYRSNMFLSQREDIDWWKCRSRSPLSFPSKICKNHGRNQEVGEALQGQQWRRESVRNDLEEAASPWGRRRALCRPPEKLAVTGNLTPEIPVWAGRKFRG